MLMTLVQYLSKKISYFRIMYLDWDNIIHAALVVLTLVQVFAIIFIGLAKREMICTTVPVGKVIVPLCF